MNSTNPSMDDLIFTRDWTCNLLARMDEAKASEECADINSIMRCCAAMCYQRQNMDNLFGSINDMGAFIERLRKDMGWLLSFDSSTNKLVCDENKPECLCPVVRACSGQISTSICHCTEGMLKAIFETGLKRKVKTKTLSSILRGGKTCSYEIVLEELSEDERNVLIKECESKG